MTALGVRFQKLLTIELEALGDELELLIQATDQRLARREITDYVRNNNSATLKNEVMGLKDCIRGCCAFDADDDDSLEVMAESVKRCVAERIRSHGYVPALYSLVEARIGRIVAFMRLGPL